MIFKKMNIVYKSKTCIYLVYICDEIVFAHLDTLELYYKELNI